METKNSKILMDNNLSPMMKQYIEICNQYKDCIMFYRVGDFYETFFEQAETVSKLLNLVLTGKDCGLDEKAPMCGVPHHALDVYLSKLVNKGYKVAVAEQIEEATNVKGIVKREVSKVYTPGTITSQEFLEDKVNNYIFSIYYSDRNFGISLFDFSTGEFSISNISESKILYDIFIKYNPKEILINKELLNSNFNINEIRDNYNVALTIIEDSIFDIDKLKNEEYDYLYKILKKINNFNEIKNSNAILSAISAYTYVKNNQKNELSTLLNINYLNDDSYMYLDAFTIKNLELTENIKNSEKKGTLLHTIDYTKTAMGGRLLRKIVEEPLKDKELILYRQEAVSEFYDKQIDTIELREYLSAIYDLERILTRISINSANAKDLISFKNSIYVLPYIKNLIKVYNAEFTIELYDKMDTLEDIYKLIDNSIIDNPPLTMHDGGIIKDGFNEEIDKLRESKIKGENWLIELEEKERKNTGIKNLKIKFSRLNGYLFEVSNSYKGDIPEHFTRKQTLASAERYTTKELTELQNLLITADDRLGNLEYEVFNQIREKIKDNIIRIKNVAMDIAKIDVFSNLSFIAKKYNYVCPNINKNGIINIVDGRHPVVENLSNIDTFISNDTNLNNENFINIITGPNMAGKSTYMRQVALIVLLAHIGSFVPAKNADINVCDRIFTRVGASDDLSRGQSTFMVEMNEVANIIKNATKNSLIILDEIGRGTSTYDGLSIAWSVVEYINDKIKSKTLFATHYHELTALEEVVDGVINFRVAVIEENDEIKFLHKIIRGSAEKSYGIAVAKLAGLPKEITDNAEKHLKKLIKEI